MANTHSNPPLLTEQNQGKAEAGQTSIPDDKALVALSSEQLDRPLSLGGPVALLPVELDVAVPVRDFRVSNLLALDCGQLIETQWGHGEDVPLASGQVQLAWSEFEVVDNQLGVRVTRLA